MTRRLLRSFALALGLSAVPALAQQAPRTPGRATPDKGSQDKSLSLIHI